MRRGPSAVNALLAVNKPLGLTSHDVVSRVRRALGEKRVGHAGTLDPAATGVLIVGVGMATKLLGLITLDSKRYRACVAFGSQTDTDDAEGQVIATAAVGDQLRDPEFARATLAALVGEHDQVPPAYSAISVNGKRAYAMARDGQQVELEPRHITIHQTALLDVAEKDGVLTWTFDVFASKGTYIRSIARDLGQSLGTCAHLCGLVRTAAGPVGLGDCVELDDLMDGGADLVAQSCLDPVALLGLPARQVAIEEVADISCGRKIACGTVVAGDTERLLGNGEKCALFFNGALVGIWERRGNALACISNYPQAIVGVR